MSDLGSDARGLLDRARRQEGPTAADSERVLASLAASLGVASSSLLATSTAAAAAPGGSTAFSLFGLLKGATAKIVLSCAAGVALGVAVTVPLTLSTPETPAPSAPVTPAPALARAAPNTPPVAQEPIPPQPVPAQAPPIATAATAVSSAPRTLGAEAELLLAAQRELSAGQPERALALLAEHDRRHPRGVLAQERAASRVLALCAAGRTAEARAEAEAFVRDAPGSPLVPRVRRSCAFAAPKSSAAFAPLTEPARPGQ